MKKNKMMRAASVLLIAVLMTTSVISGTFAKYVTEADADDSARVAKWGVELSVSGEGKLFDTEYTRTGDAITVKSQDTDNLVAPGTEDSTGITFTLKGKPEVATKVTAKLEDTSDVFLKVDENNTYYPVVFTLVHTYGDGAWSIAPVVTDPAVKVETAAGKDTITGTMAQIAAVLENLTARMTQLAPGYVYDDTFTLTWEWVFGDSANNVNDTKLGNIAAGVGKDGLTEGTDYCLKVAYNFSITVEQVD